MPNSTEDTDYSQSHLGSVIKISSALKMSVKVDIIGEKSSYIVSSIFVTASGTNTLLSAISISEENFLFGKVEVAGVFIYDVNGTLYVGSPRDTLNAAIAIRNKNKMQSEIDIVGAKNSEIDGGIFVSVPSDIYSSIGIINKNKMTSEIAINGVYRSNLQGSLTIPATNNIESSILVRCGNKMFGTSKVIPTDDSDLEGTIGIILNREIPATVLIKRSNKLYGIMDITEQPNQSTELTPVRDAFLSEKVPLLNYGGEQTLVVGLGTARYRTILGFNSSAIPEDHEVESAVLRLYITEGREPNRKLGLYATSNDWTEYGVTWINQPDKRELITDVHAIHAGSITFDITEWLKQQRKSSKTNYSFYVVAENETEQIYYSFFSRESNQKPALKILHHSLTIPSTSRANIDGSIEVNSLLTPKDIPSTIKVLPPLDTLSTEEAGISLHAWDTNAEDGDKVNVYLQTPNGNGRLIKQNWSLKSSGNSTNSDFLDIELDEGLNVIIYEGVSPGTSGDLTSNIKLLTYGTRDKAGSFPNMLSINKQGKWESLKSNEFQATIKRAAQALDGLEYIDPKPVITWRVIRRPISDIGGSVLVERRKFLESRIIVSRPNLAGDVHVRQSTDNDLHSSLVASQRDFDDFGGSILIGQPNLPSSIRVKGRSDIDGGIKVTYPITYEVPSSLFVSKGVIVSSIFVTIAGKSDMASTLRTQRPIIKKDVPAKLFVNRKSLPSRVTIRAVGNDDSRGSISILSSIQKEDLPVILSVTRNNVKSSLEVLSHDDVNSFLIVRPYHHSILDSSLGVSRGNLPSTIDVFQPRTRVSNSIKSTIDVWHKDTIESSLRVVSGNLAGQIGVMGYGDHEIPSNLTVRIRFKDDIETVIDVATVRSYLKSKLAVAKQNEMLGRVDNIVRMGKGDLPSTLHPTICNTVASTLGVRNRNHMEGNVVIGFLRESDLLSTLDIAPTSTIPCNIVVRRDGSSDKASKIIIRSKKNHDLPSSISVFSASEVPSSISVKKTVNNNLLSSIDVKRHTSLPCSILIKAKATKNLSAMIIIKQVGNRDLISLLNVVIRANDEIGGSILVGKASNIEATIAVKRTDSSDLPAKVEVWHSSKIPCEIEVNVKNEVPCSIDIVTDYGYYYIM
ncbi:DNRLRE domain-containing protein [Brevibacillus laterosporus]|uniref:DNRLRE domain-containing protein n=1 Tax=Brevibacillus laterosporus TaxID=1465 RepID=A0A518VAL9_BRELA|nr:DNRLRE domain-containing protein [Brevibacillus laterosporus]